MNIRVRDRASSKLLDNGVPVDRSLLTAHCSRFGQLGLRFHHERSFVVLGPQLHGIAFRQAAHDARRGSEHRPHRPKAERRNSCVRVSAHEIREQRRDQRPVYHEARVALLLAVWLVVVYAVGVEDQRGITEQQRFIGRDRAPPLGRARGPAQLPGQRAVARPPGRRCPAPRRSQCRRRHRIRA